MRLPSILLGLVVSTLYGAGFHLLRGGSVGRLILYLMLGWAGFWIGQIVAAEMGWAFLSIGQLHLGSATIGSILLILIGHWLSLVDRS